MPAALFWSSLVVTIKCVCCVCLTEGLSSTLCTVKIQQYRFALNSLKVVSAGRASTCVMRYESDWVSSRCRIFSASSLCGDQNYHNHVLGLHILHMSLKPAPLLCNEGQTQIPIVSTSSLDGSAHLGSECALKAS